MTGQLGLFGHHSAPRIDSRLGSIERIQLQYGAWLDVGNVAHTYERARE